MKGILFSRIGLIGLTLAFSGCLTPAPHLYVKPSPTGGTITGISYNKLADVQNYDGWQASVYLSPQRIVDASGHERFQIVVQLSRGGGGFVVIKAGRSLVLTVDGKKLSLYSKVGSGPRRSINHGELGETNVTESAIYDRVTKKEIAMIAAAKKVDVEIKGYETSVFARFSEQNFAAFQALLDNSASAPPVQ